MPGLMTSRAREYGAEGCIDGGIGRTDAIGHRDPVSKIAMAITMNFDMVARAMVTIACVSGIFVFGMATKASVSSLHDGLAAASAAVLMPTSSASDAVSVSQRAMQHLEECRQSAQFR